MKEQSHIPVESMTTSEIQNHSFRSTQKFGLQLDGKYEGFLVTHLAESFCVLKILIIAG